MNKLILSCAVLTILAFTCRLLVASEGIAITGSFQLRPTSLREMAAQPFTTGDLSRACTNGLKFDNLPSLGSGLARVGENEFVGLSDRGPNGEVGGRRTFPLPKFCPFITRFKLREGRIEIQKTILLTDTQGRALSGLSNQEREERLFESAEANVPLPFDPNGIDPEAVRVFPNGKFLISEEYGPSVLVVNTNGQVLMRYVPENKYLASATYPVRAILPPVLAQRRTNRGFEALALSPDGRTAFVMLQSPLGDENDPKLQTARVSRVLRLDLSDPLNAQVTGHFLMPLSHATNYSFTQKQTGVKLNDAEWIAPNKLLVLEQAGGEARLLVTDFTAATNLQNHPAVATTAFEAAGDDLSKWSINAAVVEVWGSIKHIAASTTKLEGLAIVSPTEIAIANDNDFGLGDNNTSTPSSVWIFHLSRALPLAR